MTDLTATAAATMADLLQRRGAREGGPTNTIRLWERTGAFPLEPTAFPPDPGTYRGDYYYDTNTDRLYRKVVVRSDPAAGIIVAHWQGISR